MPTVTDYTKRRVRGQMQRCPVCGRVGKRTTYREGDSAYTHTGRTVGLFFEVLDWCPVAKGA